MRGGTGQPRLSGGGAGSWFGRSAANLLRTFNKHTPGRLQGGRFDLLGVWYLFFLKKRTKIWPTGSEEKQGAAGNTETLM